MPTSSIDLYQMQDARNNFDAMRPAPICDVANQFVGQCQSHISSNCYYGYQGPKHTENTDLKESNSLRFDADVAIDCEMTEAPLTTGNGFPSASPQSNARKRSAEDDNNPSSKRPREEIQKEKNYVPETTESVDLDPSAEDLLEKLYWNIHGGNIFQLVQCL